MKTIKTLLLLTAVVLVFDAAKASPVTPKRAAMVAQNFFHSISAAKGGELQDRSKDWHYDAIYLFVGRQGGFVLVSADDAARPILGYSATGTLDPNNMPPTLQQWLQGYQQEIALLREAKATSFSDGAAEWYAWEHNLMPKDTLTDTVAPMLTTRWNQTYPYSYYCPQGTVTGCAATAQAQVMNFWQYPAFGQGSHSYEHYTYGVQQADFAHTLYDWANMPSEIDYNSQMEEVEAVGTLMYHCGVSLEMDYGTAAQGGSAATGLVGYPGFTSIDNALKDYFYYSPDMVVLHKDFGFSNEVWRDTLMADLDLGHPIVYTGSAAAGGHGFICDGYDCRGYFHFNFGWSGLGDGFFPVDSISPGVGGAGGNGTYTFNMSNSALLNLVPDYRLRVSDTAFSVSRVGAQDSFLVSVNERVEAEWSMAVDADWITVEFDTFERAGWIRFDVQENNSGEERVAVLTFTQGDETCTVRVAQAAYDPEEMCPLTVVMESTRGNGWQGGAHLTLESASGYVYGTAQLEDGERDSVVILVAPDEAYSVWHSGGGTDRYINYYVRNQYGEDFVAVEYAYRNGGTHPIQWPCAHVGIADAPAAPAAVEVYPNPVHNILNIKADCLQKVELMDMSGRRITTTTQSKLDLGKLPVGAYFVRVTTANNTTVKRVVKK